MDPSLFQKQLHDNARDLEEYSRDLKSWGEEMKRKEVSSKKKQDHSDDTKKQKTTRTPKESISKIGTTDYSAWEKFDADAELNKLDGDIDDDSELSDEIDNKARDEALVQKEKGNRLVKDKKWDEAITCYTLAIKAFSYDPVFYANRALCYLKKEDYVNTEQDCTLSLKLDNTYVKALQRRAAAREKMNKLEEAQDDLERVLKLEPKNKESLAALEGIKNKIGRVEIPAERPLSKFSASRSKLQKNVKLNSNLLTCSSVSNNISIAEVKERSKIAEDIHSKENAQKADSKILPKTDPQWPHIEDIVLVKSINKPPHLGSTKPLKRIQIVEINSCETTEIASVEQTKQKTIHESKRDIQKENNELVLETDSINDSNRCDTRSTDVNDLIENKSVCSVFKKKREQPKNGQDNKLAESGWPRPNQEQTTLKCDELQVIEKIKTENSCNLILTNSGKHLDDLDKFVKNSVQFYNLWRNFSTAGERYIFLKKINPRDIPNIFNESLDSNVFSSILLILTTEFIDKNDDVYEYLFNFTKVKRFSALVMFMDSADKTCVLKLISHVRECENKTKDQIDYLVEKYEL